MMLRVCPREQKLITALKKQCNNGVHILYDKILGTGDISIHATNDVTRTPFAVMERKTTADLQSSLKDQRYTTQTDRLKAMLTVDECHVAGYIVEGRMSGTLLEDVRDSIQFQHKLLFCQTEDVDATASLLLRIARKAAMYESKIERRGQIDQGTLGGAPTGAFAKKGELRTKFFFHHQLMLVPGVSASIAQSITTLYPSLRSLTKAWDACASEQDRKTMLSPITTNVRSKRKLGIKLSEKIYVLFNSCVIEV